MRRVVVTGSRGGHPARSRRALDVGGGRRGAERSGLDPLVRRERLPGAHRVRGEGLRARGSRRPEGRAPARAERRARRRGGARGVERRGRRRGRPRSRRHPRRLGDRRCDGRPRPERGARSERGHTRVSPWFLPNVLVDSASGQIAIDLGLRGPELRAGLGVRDRLARGRGGRRADPARRRGRRPRGRHRVLHAPGDPRRVLRDARSRRRGGGPDAGLAARSTRRAPGSSWARARACSCSRISSAREARGARIYAEVLGYGTSNDAHHMAQPDPESVGVAEMMRAALERAGVEPERVGYINAHGTSTPQGDLAETKAIKEVFGDHAYELAVSSTKSVLGHLFGAAGAVEAMMCVRALHEGVLPPTINYRTPDPECDLDYVPNEARRTQVDVALSNAMGLGGHNACVLLGSRRSAPSVGVHDLEPSAPSSEARPHDPASSQRVCGRRVAPVRDRDDAHPAPRAPRGCRSRSPRSPRSARARRRAAAPPRGRRPARACRARTSSDDTVASNSSAMPAAVEHARRSAGGSTTTRARAGTPRRAAARPRPRRRSAAAPRRSGPACAARPRR